MPADRGLLSLLLIAGLTAAGCSGGRGEGPEHALRRMRASCLLVVLDAAAAGHVGAYGYSRGTTPTIDALAVDGVLFERAYSQGASTSVSVPSYLSGLYPHTLALRRRRDRKSRPFYLPDAFRAAGFRTAGFSRNPIVSGAFSADAGFEHFVEIEMKGTGTGGSRRLVAEAISWMAANRGSRFFAYVHLLRPHNPYLPPEDIARRFWPPSYRGSLTPDTDTLLAVDRGTIRVSADDLAFIVSQYDANLFYGDRLIAQLLDGLRVLGLLGRTLVVVMADHGEAFGQHGRFLHNSTLYEEMIRVPLVLRFPPGAGVAAGRIRAPVALVDIYPTLARLFSLSAPGGDGRSLVPLIVGRGGWGGWRLIFSQAYGSVAAIGPEFKYIADMRYGPLKAPRREELYLLTDDPRERRDVSGVEARKTREMRLAVKRFLAGEMADQSVEAAARSMTPERRRQLRALGYLR